MQNKILFLVMVVVLLYLLYRVWPTCITAPQRPVELTGAKTESFDEGGRRIALIYAYYEKNDEYKENFQYFLKRGILKEVDYYIVINGACTVDIPEWANVRVYRRENKGFDFGAYGHAMRKLEKEYDYYFFMNTSVKGPYYPPGVGQKWINYFLPLFSKETKLVGTSINVYTVTQHHEYNLERIYGHAAPFSHVQTMFFGVDRELFLYLEDISFFSEVEMELKSMNYTVVFKEIGLSQKVLAKGWNIGCILPEYQRDYREVKEDFNPTSLNGEMYYPGRYFGKTVQPEQVIFYKGYRMG